MAKLKGLDDLLGVAQRSTAFEEKADALIGTSHGLGDLIDILGLDNGLEVIFQKLGEIVCTW